MPGGLRAGRDPPSPPAPGPPPTYRIALCEGARCIPVLDLDDAPATEAEAVAFLAQIAQRLRERGAVGRVLLLNGRAGAVVAARRVWP